LRPLAGILPCFGFTAGNGFFELSTGLFEHLTNRKLKARDYSYDSTSEDYDPDNAILNGYNRDRIMLPQYPVNSITTLRINEMEISARDTMYGCGYVLSDKEAGVVTLSCYLFTTGLKNIELAFNAGFSTVPDDLEQAVIEQAAWLFKQAGIGGNLLGVSAKTLADGSISYHAKELLPSVRGVIETYKRRVAL